MRRGFVGFAMAFGAALALMTVAELPSAERFHLENKLAELRAILEQRTVAVAVP